MVINKIIFIMKAICFIIAFFSLCTFLFNPWKILFYIFAISTILFFVFYAIQGEIKSNEK